jgi:hypothetical protein
MDLADLPQRNFLGDAMPCDRFMVTAKLDRCSTFNARDASVLLKPCYRNWRQQVSQPRRIQNVGEF